MQITTSEWSLERLGMLLSRYQAVLSKLLFLLGLIYCLNLVSGLIWLVLPSPQPTNVTSNSATVQAAGRSSTQNIDLDTLLALNLFGRAVAPQAEPSAATSELTELPLTQLNLTLSGVVASNVATQGVAIIIQGNQQQSYVVGERIKGTSAFLSQVYGDRVLIKNGSQRETLMLDGIDFNEANRRLRERIEVDAKKVDDQLQSQPQDTANAVLAADTAQRLRDELASGDVNFADYIALNPARDGATLLGYRISPGHKPALFNSAGLQPGDLVTQINGIPLNDLSMAMDALSELRSAQNIQLELIRQEETMLIDIQLPTGDTK